MKIYLASSWRNAEQVKAIADTLRSNGHEVDAFCDESTGRFVFSFSQLPDIEKHNAMTILGEESVKRAFAEDKKWIDWADCVILILPSGKSAHMEAGYASGAGKHLIIYQEDFPHGEFDVMYGFADLVTDSLYEVIDLLGNRRDLAAKKFRRVLRDCGYSEEQLATMTDEDVEEEYGELCRGGE